MEIPQTMPSLSPAMKELERLIRSHEMLHIHNTCARWCFGNVRCAVDGNENIKPMKNKSIGRIDITVAWIIAVAVCLIYRAQRWRRTGEFEMAEILWDPCDSDTGVILGGSAGCKRGRLPCCRGVDAVGRGGRSGRLWRLLGHILCSGGQRWKEMRQPCC